MAGLSSFPEIWKKCFISHGEVENDVAFMTKKCWKEKGIAKNNAICRMHVASKISVNSYVPHKTVQVS